MSTQDGVLVLILGIFGVGGLALIIGEWLWDLWKERWS